MEGKTWLLLPEGFRDPDAAKEYPLPLERTELMKIFAIPIPPNKNDGGCFYIKRAYKKVHELNRRTQSAALRTYDTERKAIKAKSNFDATLGNLRKQAWEATNRLKAEAEQAIAGLNDLWALGRKGIEGQMKAHLDGTQWHGEEIDAKAFRECFRMVTQAVKGLGMPTDQRDKAVEVVMEEAARAMESTQEALALAPNAEDDKNVN